MNAPTIASHFDRNDPVVKAIYDRLLADLAAFGEVHEAPKQTSIHLDNANGFAGVYTRKSYINLRFRLARKLDDPRITKTEQISANRFMHTVKLTSVDDVDPQLLAWMEEAYALAG